mgnify:FL=1
MTGAGSLAALKHVGTAEKQYIAIREEEGQEGDMQAPLDGPGQEVQLYESEKLGEDGGRRKGEQKHFGEQRMKEDRKEWVTRGTERKVREEKREEGGRKKKMEGQWILTWKEKKGGATEVGPGRLEGGKRRGEVASEEGWDEEYRLTANNGKYVVTLHVDNGSGRQEE